MKTTTCRRNLSPRMTEYGRLSDAKNGMNVVTCACVMKQSRIGVALTNASHKDRVTGNATIYNIQDICLVALSVTRSLCTRMSTSYEQQRRKREPIDPCKCCSATTLIESAPLLFLQRCRARRWCAWRRHWPPTW